MTSGDRWALRLGTWFGCGRSPVAPGTAGTLGALPLHLVLSRLPPALHWALVGAISVLGIWSGERMVELLDDKDPQSAVIDEVAGVLIALGIVRGRGLKSAVLATLLFRILDITKPGPIDSAQHVKPAGLGVMADDLLAGIIAGLSVRFLSPRR